MVFISVVLVSVGVWNIIVVLTSIIGFLLSLLILIIYVFNLVQIIKINWNKWVRRHRDYGHWGFFFAGNDICRFMDGIISDIGDSDGKISCRDLSRQCYSVDNCFSNLHIKKAVPF